MLKRAVLALFTTVSFPLLGCQGGEAAKEDSAARGTPAYSGKTLDGEILKLEDLHGKVVLLNVWATWCAPCREELPELEALHHKHGGENFSVLGVSVDSRGDLEKVNAMVRRYGLEYPMIFDPGATVIGAFGVTGYPTSFLLGKDGQIRWRRNGVIANGDPELDRQLGQAFASPG